MIAGCYVPGMALAALLISVVALVAAGASARYAAMQGIETRNLRRLDEQRRHDALTPQFELTLESRGDEQLRSPRLSVRLIGPVGLDRLDEVTVSVRDDRPHRGRHALAGGPDEAAIAAQVWGPYRFRPGVDGADPDGRSVASVALEQDEPHLFQMERTLPPPWYTPATSWECDHPVTAPVRLTFHCRHDGHAWDVPHTVTATDIPY
jgi:hypothetical protein